ncbi:hypothetical protein HG263_04330 [Pseudoalteromonas sp. JBTF-M23]|uniref:Uncharacterized protein n=1 Tax=Pseudoalteromonas caenipelagi TaxID=2726988 RepID=A0A849VDJ1_9GAMM|nr:hypothetical protein [Pseudoalteromonas caenipelagi]
MDELLKPIKQFLQCDTPDAWVAAATKPENLPVVLIDHLICELKAYMCKLLNGCTTDLFISAFNGDFPLGHKLTTKEA